MGRDTAHYPRTSTSGLPAVFQALGRRLESPEAGCRGTAGTFGHEVRNRAAIAEKLHGTSWQPKVASARRETVPIETGHACRSQVKLIERRPIPHSIQVLPEGAKRRLKQP